MSSSFVTTFFQEFRASTDIDGVMDLMSKCIPDEQRDQDQEPCLTMRQVCCLHFWVF